MVASPFCHFELRAARGKPARYPKQINSLGDHIRARRLDLRLLQRQVAEHIGVHEITITGWECNATVPEIRYMTAIIQFLGYDPLPSAAAFPELLGRTSGMLGLSQRKMAEKLGVDPTTIEDWEAGQHRPTRENLDVIAKVFQNR